jgi:hypothetical protein
MFRLERYEVWSETAANACTSTLSEALNGRRDPARAPIFYPVI